MLGDGYQRALEQCVNLRELHLSSCEGNVPPSVTDEMIRTVFAPSRFPKLEHLSIDDLRRTSGTFA